MRFLFSHYYDLLPSSITQQDIINYICFIVKEHGVGREKCHQAAQACSFYYKYVYPSAFIIPAGFYPRKTHKLPQVFSVEQIPVSYTHLDVYKRQLVHKEMANFESAGKLSEEGYDLLTNWYRQYKQVEKADSLVAAKKAAFPDGKWKKSEAGMAIAREKDIHKKITLFNEYLQDDPAT